MVDKQNALTIASHMRALSMMFEGEASNRNRIQYQAVVGWDPDQIGERCRLIDLAHCDGVIAVFDPAAIERGLKFVGVSIPDGCLVRLELGSLWVDANGRAALVTRGNHSHLIVKDGRFVERPGKPTHDLSRGAARARRQLAELAAEARLLSNIVIMN